MSVLFFLFPTKTLLLRDDIGTIEDHGGILKKQIHRTGITAESISSQVRELDRAQTNVHVALQRVEKMVQLKVSI